MALQADVHDSHIRVKDTALHVGRELAKLLLSWRKSDWKVGAAYFPSSGAFWGYVFGLAASEKPLDMNIEFDSTPAREHES